MRSRKSTGPFKVTFRVVNHAQRDSHSPPHATTGRSREPKMTQKGGAKRYSETVIDQLISFVIPLISLSLEDVLVNSIFVERIRVIFRHCFSYSLFNFGHVFREEFSAFLEICLSTCIFHRFHFSIVVECTCIVSDHNAQSIVREC